MNDKVKIYIPVIVCLRGIAALGVVLYHYVCGMTGFVVDPYVLSVFNFGELGVPLFFLISGIVIPLHMLQTNYDYSHLRQFFLRRLVRVEPAYLIALLGGILFWNLRDQIYGSTFAPSLRDIFLHLGYLIPFFDDAQWVSTVFWTLAIEFQYYLFLALLFPFVASNSRWVQNLTILGFVALSVGSQNRAYLLNWLPLFFVGITYALFLFKRIRLSDFVCWLVVCLLIAGLKDLGASLVAVFGLLIVHYIPKQSFRPIAWLGDISYSLYLFHGLTGGVLINMVSHHVDTPVLKFLLILVGLIVAVMTAWFMYVVVERPSHRRAKQI